MQRRTLLYASTALLGALVVSRACSGLNDAVGPSADVLAQWAEDNPRIPISDIPPGDILTIVYKQRPIAIWHRNAEDMVTLARPDDTPWLVVWSMCPRLGCALSQRTGDFGGFFCVCCATHYDLAGRMRKGIAPRDLYQVPFEIQGDEIVLPQLSLPRAFRPV